MSERVEVKRGGATIRVVPEQVEFWESKGYSAAPKPARRGRKPKTEEVDE